MKLSRGKRQSLLSPLSPFSVVCHRILFGNSSRHPGGPNERTLIPLIWPGPNLLTVPYIVPVLISLVLCVILTSPLPPLPLRDTFNWNGNEFLNKCTSIRPTLCISLWALKSLLILLLRPSDRAATTPKVTFSVLVTFICACAFFLLLTNSHAVNAQRLAFLDAESMDSFEHEEEDDNERTAYPTIKVLVNGSVGLPCNISQTKEENSIKLILWYKNNILGTPIYSIDARDVNISQARHFVAPLYRERASFELNFAARLAVLLLKPINEEDDAEYICRVDPRWSRTTVSHVKLDVVVPAQRLRLIQLPQQYTSSIGGSNRSHSKLWDSVAATRHWHNNGTKMHSRQEHPAFVLSILHNGSMINEIATVRQPEETELTILCDSIGGRPRSIVKWYRLGESANISAALLYASLQSTDENTLQLIDDTFHQVNHTEDERIESTLVAATKQRVPHKANGPEESHTALVRNELHLGLVRDANHGQLYLCRTSNSNLSKPLDAIVRLEIYTRPKTIQIRQQMPSKEVLTSSSRATFLPPQVSAEYSHPEEEGLVRNRTLHSISLLDYYLNARQPLMMQPFRLRSGLEFEFLCESNGSKPASKMAWALRDYRTNVEKDITQLSSSYFNGHDTLSLLRFVPKFTDNRASLICRAWNEALREWSTRWHWPPLNDSINSWNGYRRDHYGDANKSQMTQLTSNLPFQLETSVLLDVNYKPIVTIKILSGEQMYREVAQPKSTGSSSKTISTVPLESTVHSNSNHHRFLLSHEIFFNCSINANPYAHLVTWFFNSKPLQIDLNHGLIITNSNRTLILSSASRANAGYFHCSATNLLGETNSERHQIDVLFEPECRVDYTLTLYRQLNDIVHLKCQVLANPVDNLQFVWQFNGTLLSLTPEHEANRSTGVGHAVPSEEEDFTEGEEANLEPYKASSDKSRRKANAIHSSRSATHSSSDQQHLISNVVRIELRKWTSFGHFSCRASNKIGQQKEACKWHIVPRHFYPHHEDGSDEHLSGGSGGGGQEHQRRYHHRHHQQHQTSTLNNCQIIESSNAVVIKCREAHSQEAISRNFLAQIDSDVYQNESSAIDRAASASDEQQRRVTHAEIPTRLTYHVQVFQLADHASRTNSSLPVSTDWNSKSPDPNGAEQQYFPQIDRPELGKRVASKFQYTSQPPSTVATEPVLVLDTVNFTNPLFIITNLSASTSYMLKIWSSKAHLDYALEQVNITVRTRPNDDIYPKSKEDAHSSSMSVALSTLLKMGSEKLILLVGLVAIISVVFVSLTLTYAIFRIRAILDIRKARREVNVNETISAFETALCEMRPDQLENDLKTRAHYSMDTFRPYISVDSVTDDCLIVSDQIEACRSTLNRQLPDSSLITYPNYLYPSAATATHPHKGGLRPNCSTSMREEEESLSTSNTSASTRSILTNTTESTNANTNSNLTEVQFGKRCFAPPVTLDTTTANMLAFCMDASDLGPSRASHAYLVPESNHPYPLQLRLLPEDGDARERSLGQPVTVVSTPSADKCAYLLSTERPNQMFDLYASMESHSQSETTGQGTKSIQTTV